MPIHKTTLLTMKLKRKKWEGVVHIEFIYIDGYNMFFIRIFDSVSLTFLNYYKIQKF